MLHLLIDAARDAGCDGVELTTQQQNEKAFALYQKIGFVYHGDVENVAGDGQRLTERAMFYELRPNGARFEGPHRPPV